MEEATWTVAALKLPKKRLQQLFFEVMSQSAVVMIRRRGGAGGTVDPLILMYYISCGLDQPSDLVINLYGMVTEMTRCPNSMTNVQNHFISHYLNERLKNDTEAIKKDDSNNPLKDLSNIMKREHICWVVPPISRFLTAPR